VIRYIFLLLFCVPLRAQLPADSLFYQEMEISMFTCDPGEELYSTFGHTAVRIKNPSQRIDYVFNYGTFDFKTQGFYLKFLRGILPYRLVVEDISSFLNEYHYFNRGVREQVLDINDSEKEKIWLFLQENLKPENVEYPYDFFFDNCSTRVRDLLLRHIDTDESADLLLKNEGAYSFRQMLHQYLASSPWTRLGIDLIIGKKADRIATISEQMFLPDYLHDNIIDLKSPENKLIAAQSYKVLPFDDMRAKVMTPTTNWPLLLFTSLSLILLLLKYKFSHMINTKMLNILIFVFGLGGCVILFMTVGTVHYATKLNFNLMFLHPGFLVISFLKGKNQDRFISICMLLVLLFALLAGLGLANSMVSTWPLALFILSVLWVKKSWKS
jgi:hypothetical protein